MQASSSISAAGSPPDRTMSPIETSSMARAGENPLVESLEPAAQQDDAGAGCQLAHAGLA